jgi:hypothetical protein
LPRQHLQRHEKEQPVEHERGEGAAIRGQHETGDGVLAEEDG